MHAGGRKLRRRGLPDWHGTTPAETHRLSATDCTFRGMFAGLTVHKLSIERAAQII